MENLRIIFNDVHVDHIEDCAYQMTEHYHRMVNAPFGYSIEIEIDRFYDNFKENFFVTLIRNMNSIAVRSSDVQGINL